MTKQTICPSCDAWVSSQASACPKCGHQFKNPGAVDLSDPVHIVGLLVCVFIILCVMAGILWAMF